MARYALLAGTHQLDSHKPLVEWNLRAFKDSTNSDGDVLIMHITTVGKLAKEIDVEQWFSESEARVAKSACGDPKYRQILQSGVIYEYRYRDESGAPVVSVQLSKSDCE